MFTQLGFTCMNNPENGQNETYFNRTYFFGQNGSADDTSENLGHFCGKQIQSYYRIILKQQSID